MATHQVFLQLDAIIFQKRRKLLKTNNNFFMEMCGKSLTRGEMGRIM
jgi:hypothetical protein